MNTQSRAMKVIYWISTIWLALGMVSTGVVQLLSLEAEMDFITNLGYPVYFLTLLGFWKLAGTAAVLIPKMALLKEWAYAGFFFMMSGAVYSHIAAGADVSEMLPALLLLILTSISWATRPGEKRINPVKTA